jgi:hypothetical protein
MNLMRKTSICKNDNYYIKKMYHSKLPTELPNVKNLISLEKVRCYPLLLTSLKQWVVNSLAGNTVGRRIFQETFVID